MQVFRLEGWVKDNKAAIEGVHEFRECIEPHEKEKTALQIFYGEPYMVIERNSGSFGKKPLPMSTLTVTANDCDERF